VAGRGNLQSAWAPAAVLLILAIAAGGSTAPDARLPGAVALTPGAPAPPCSSDAPGAPGIAVGGGIQYLSASDRSRELDDLQALGARWIRFDIAWSDIQRKGPDRYDWARYDAVIGAASSRHLGVLGMIGYTPRWAAPHGATSDKVAPRDTADYARFAAAAVRRYASLGVHAWEIWNEPNNPHFWRPAPRLDQYATMLEQASAAIMAVDPTAIVLTGGTSPTETTSDSISPVDFLRGLYANGAGRSFDAVAVHPYTYPAFPSDSEPSSAWSQLDRTTPSLRSVMVDHGDGSKKIWVTEFGAPTSDTGVTDAQQAAMITQAYAIFRSEPWAGPLFVYSYSDQGDEDRFGLLRDDGSRKPSWGAFRHAAKAADAGCGASPPGELRSGSS
jgi:hypothetical protein